MRALPISRGFHIPLSKLYGLLTYIPNSMYGYKAKGKIGRKNRRDAMTLPRRNIPFAGRVMALPLSA
jgi:hypothetical protein